MEKVPRMVKVKAKTPKYSLNLNKLSNEKLIDLWLSGDCCKFENYNGQVLKILIDRDVVRME